MAQLHLRCLFYLFVYLQYSGPRRFDRVTLTLEEVQEAISITARGTRLLNECILQ